MKRIVGLLVILAVSLASPSSARALASGEENSGASGSGERPVTIAFSYYVHWRPYVVGEICSLRLPRGSDGVEVLRAAVNQDCIRSFRTTAHAPDGSRAKGREWLHCINDVCARVTNSPGIVPDTRWDADWTGEMGKGQRSDYYRSGLGGYSASDGDSFTAYLVVVN